MDPSLHSSDWAGRRVRVIVDWPLGSSHPDDPSFTYHLNYGFIPGTKAPNGEPLDVYVIDATEPISECDAEVIAIIRRRADDEDKLVVRMRTGSWELSGIETRTLFQEQWFDSYVEST